jgi:lysophospholipase L1-like esterase
MKKLLVLSFAVTAILTSFGAGFGLYEDSSRGNAILKVACVGDSITYGLGLEDRDRTSYPAQLQLILDAEAKGKYEVRNFGNSGRGIYLDSMRGNEKRGFKWMKEHQAALDWKPDVVICNLGINDNGEYIKEYTGGRKRGSWAADYVALLEDYRKANPKVKFFIWTKLAPLAPGQKFYRSPEPFLMQRDLEAVARKTGAVGIDMQAPLMAEMDEILAVDKIHPNAKGARIIAETTANALLGKVPQKTCEQPKEGETWLCVGQSNMQQGWNVYNRPGEEHARYEKELAQLSKVKVNFWDFNTGKWERLTPQNGGRKSAFGVSFAIRRALMTRKPVNMVYVAAGGAPTESFICESTMCQVDKSGGAVYPSLMAIATNRHRLDANADFPCKWVAREYPRRSGNMEEGHWWPVSLMYDEGISKVKDLKLDGILWYQGESNATLCVGSPDQPLDTVYMEETLRAVVEELRGKRKIPFVLMGLPKMNRPWEPYRAAQAKIAQEKGCIFVDTFAAGLGDMNDVHPRNKIPFAELAIEALKKAGK